MNCSMRVMKNENILKNKSVNSKQETSDTELAELVKEIFKVIPSYYDRREAKQVEDLIRAFVEKKLQERR